MLISQLTFVEPQVDKVALEQGSYVECMLGFKYALRRRTLHNMFAIVMEDKMQNNCNWHGGVGYYLANNSCKMLMSDVPELFNESLRGIAKQIDWKLAEVLSNEQQVAADFISASRSSSPSLSEIKSGTSTPLKSVVGMHVDGAIHTFRNDLKIFIKDFRDGSSEQHREWRLCELLLVGFVRNLVAPQYEHSHDDSLGDLTWWQGKCKNPDTSLAHDFQTLMGQLKPIRKLRLYIYVV